MDQTKHLDRSPEEIYASYNRGWWRSATINAFAALLAACTTYSTFGYLDLPRENNVLRSIIQMQNNALKAIVIDTDDLCDLLRFLQCAYVRFPSNASEDGLATDTAALFADFDAYIRRHKNEMNGVRIDCKKWKTVTRAQRRSFLELHSDPEKFKIIVATFCLEILYLVRDRDQNLTESWRKVVHAADEVITELKEIVDAEKSGNPVGGTDTHSEGKEVVG